MMTGRPSGGSIGVFLPVWRNPMKTFVVVVVLGLVAAGLFGGGVVTSAPAQEKAAPAVKWEYAVEHGDPDPKRMNALGAEGWEMVSDIPRTDRTQSRQVYKRPAR